MTRNDHRLPRSRVMLAYLAAVTCGFASAALRPAPAAAAGVVGTGTPESCTDAALNVALAGGGLVTFNCGPDLVTVDISAGTGSKAITEDTTIDGGAMITISGGGEVVFRIDAGVSVHVENLTIARGVPVGIVNEGTLPAGGGAPMKAADRGSRSRPGSEIPKGPKAGLMLSDIASVGFKVENFDHSNMKKLEARWSQVADALRLTARLAASFGLSRDTINADSAVWAGRFSPATASRHAVRADQRFAAWGSLGSRRVRYSLVL